MPAKTTKPPATTRTLIDLTKTTQDLLTHFQSSLTAAATAPKPTSTHNATPTDTPSPPTISPLAAVKATTTLLRSHTTTLSLLLLTPPLTPSAIITKIGDVSAGALSGLVATVASLPGAGETDELGNVMRAELRAQVRRLLDTWGGLLNLVSAFAERREKDAGKKDNGPSEAEKADVLATTGVVWEACDALLKVCDNGVVGLVVKKAEEWRSVLLDAVEELKEWGEDVADEDDGDDVEGSDDEFADEDAIFGAQNKLGKEDVELKALLDASVKKLKMVSVLYQALVKRRLKTFPRPGAQKENENEAKKDGEKEKAPAQRLDELLAILKAIPETVDDLASAFYDLDEGEAKRELAKCCSEAKSAIAAVKKSWAGQDDEFTAWSSKFVEALDAA